MVAVVAVLTQLIIMVKTVVPAAAVVVEVELAVQVILHPHHHLKVIRVETANLFQLMLAVAAAAQLILEVLLLVVVALVAMEQVHQYQELQ
jgi:hypothetical protein